MGYKKWALWLANFICDHGIEHIFPAHDSVIEALAISPPDAKVLGVPRGTALICRSKKKTYETLRDVVRCPQVFDAPRYPMFIKPDKAQGSRGCSKVEHEDQYIQAYRAAAEWGEVLMLELLTGHEVTVDCFSDSGKLVWCMPRIREAVRGGISVSTRVLPNRAHFYDIAGRISEKIKFHGAWFYQLKFHDGEYVLLECAPRIAGGSALARMRGVNLPALTLAQAMGETWEIRESPEPDAMNRVLANVFKYADREVEEPA